MGCALRGALEFGQQLQNEGMLQPGKERTVWVHQGEVDTRRLRPVRLYRAWTPAAGLELNRLPWGTLKVWEQRKNISAIDFDFLPWASYESLGKP